MSTPYCMDCGKSGADLKLTRVNDRPTCGPCLRRSSIFREVERWQKVCQAAKAHGHKAVRVDTEFLSDLLDRVADLEEPAPWSDEFAAEVLAALKAGSRGDLLRRLRGDERCSDASCAKCRTGEPCQ